MSAKVTQFDQQKDTYNYSSQEGMGDTVMMTPVTKKRKCNDILGKDQLFGSKDYITFLTVREKLQIIFPYLTL